MKNIKEHIIKGWNASVDSIDANTLDDIYSFSFYVCNDEDDPRSPTLTIGFNTNSHLKSEINNASNENEAKWNYAFWLQNEIAVIGTDGDSEGKSLINQWILDLGLNYTDEEEDQDFDSCLEKGERITENFIRALIEIVREIHDQKSLSKPIIIHELEYYDQIRDQNIEANGAERVKEFSNWINEM